MGISCPGIGSEWRLTFDHEEAAKRIIFHTMRWSPWGWTRRRELTCSDGSTTSYQGSLYES
jgi:hypothetical protein